MRIRFSPLSFAGIVLAATASAQNTSPAGAGTAARPAAAARRVLSSADYTRWRTIDNAALSPDGKWLAYGLRFANTLAIDGKPELRIRRTDAEGETVVKDGGQASFSSNSKWIVYSIEPPAPAGGRGGRGGGGGATAPGAAPSQDSSGRAGAAAPAPRKTELRELATGTVASWQDIQTATFSPTATHLLLRRRATPAAGAQGTGAGAPPQAPPGGGGRGGAAGAAPTIRGTDALLHNLATGMTQYLGNVGDAAFNRPGTLLAYTVEAPVRDGNGLFVVDLASGRTWVLDNDARTYSRLTWNDAGTALAVLKAKDVPRMRERENVIMVVPNVRAAMADGAKPRTVSLDTATAGFPRGWLVSDRATLEFSDDDARVFFGMIHQVPAPDTSLRRRNTDSIPDVDVWRTEDERVQSLQMIRAEADRNFTFREALDVAAGTFVKLADSTLKDLDVSPDGRWAMGRDTRGYVTDYGEQKADVYRVNPATGERTLAFKALTTNLSVFGFSPDGKHWLYWKDSKFHQYDVEAGTSKPLNAAGAPSFLDVEYDHPGVRPSYGVAGFAKDGSGVIVNHRYDMWFLPYGSGVARNLTNGEGAKKEVRYRLANTVPADPMAPRADREARVVDLAKPVTLSMYGEWTKKAGFAELMGGTLRTINFEDASFSTPVRALKADRYLLTRQTFTEFPDLRVAGPDFGASTRLSDANPQQADFAWGRRVLFDFKLKDGKRSQGVLTLPDDYQPGEKRPMIVNFYEKNSQNLHRYQAPSFATGMGATPVEAVSRGYITMMPDVYFRTGQSHSDMLEAVEAATRKVIEMGYVDPKKIGVHGHSYGGEGAAFIGTRSRLFAAVGVGAGVSDLTTDFSQSWGWTYAVNGGSGQNAFDYYMEGQGRWGFSPWEKPEVYRFESALTHVPEVTAPFLIMHGTADPTVSFVEGMNLYSALRFNKKTAIMLAYPNEGHGLAGMANRRDLTTRYFQFFDHYLKGAPAPAWMKEGVPYLVKDATRITP
jgi:dipeptidyl aminopeptidase/acylaminoacyl peptidase